MAWTFGSVRAKDVVAEFVRLRAEGDFARAFTLAHDDVEFVLHLSEKALGIGGVHRGRSQLVAMLLSLGAEIEHLAWQPRSITEECASGSARTVRVRAEFLLRHRPTGAYIDGTCRMLFTVTDGVITRVEEFHDRARMEAFLNLVAPRPDIEDDDTISPESELVE